MNDIELKSKLSSYQSFFETIHRKSQLSWEGKRCLRVANYVLRGEGTRKITPNELEELDKSIKVIRIKESDFAEDQKPPTNLFRPLWSLLQAVSSIGSMLWQQMGRTQQVDAAMAAKQALDLQKRIEAYRDEIQQIAREVPKDQQTRAANLFLEKLLNDTSVKGDLLLELFKQSAQLGGGDCTQLERLHERCQLTHVDITDILNGWIHFPHTQLNPILDRISILVDGLNYHDQPTLIQLAKKAAKECPITLACDIARFKIDDPAELEQIARDCINHEGSFRLDYLSNLNPFNNFGIYDENLLAEFLVTLFRFTLATPTRTLDDLDCSHFPSVEVRQNIVLRIIANRDNGINPWRSHVLKNLKKFDLPVAFRDELIKKYTLELPYTAIAHLKAHPDTSETAIAEIKEVLRTNLIDLAENDANFLSYALEIIEFLELDFDQKMQILLILARVNPVALIYDLPKFNIDDQACLFKIADVCDEAEKSIDPSSPLTTLSNINNFFPENYPLILANEELGKLPNNYSDLSFSVIKTYLQLMELYSKRNVGPLLRISAQIESTTDEDTRNQLYFALFNKTKLLGDMYLNILFRFRDTQTSIIVESDLIVKVLDLTIPSLRRPLFYLVSPFFAELSEEAKTFLDNLQTVIDGTPSSKVPIRWYVIQLVKVLAWYGVETDILAAFMKETFRYAQNFKSSETGDRVILMLYNLVLSKELTAAEKGDVLRKIVRASLEKREIRLKIAYPNVRPKEEQLDLMVDKESKAAKRIAATVKKDREAFEKKNKNERELLEAIESVLMLSELNDIRGALEPISLEERLTDTFSKIVPFHIQDDKETFVSRYLATFGQSRIPNGIFVYGAGLNTLNDDGKGVASFGEFVSSIFNSDFKEKRYCTAGSPHLFKLASTHPELFEKWKLGDKTTFKELLPNFVAGEKQEFDYLNWLLTLIGDSHILIHEYQMGYLIRLQQHPEDYQGLLREIQSVDLTSSNEDRNLIIFQKLVLSLIGANNEQALVIFNELRSLINADSRLSEMEFIIDVQGMLEPRKATLQNNFSIVDTDDPYDLFYSGSEVTGSCQQLGGFAGNNRGLLGTLLHGYNRMIKISDTVDSKTTARSLIRILWNADEMKWVMLMERVYPANADFMAVSALTAMAKRRASDLGVDLVITALKNAKGVPYGNKIESLGGRAPYEYSDAARGVCVNGQYAITTANILARYQEP